MKKVVTLFCCFFRNSAMNVAALLFLIGLTGIQNVHSQNCTPISPLPCNQLQVNLPFTLTFNSGIDGTIADKNGAGTGFTMVDTYSGTRHTEDGTPSNADVPGYEASKLTLTSGQLQVVTNKGIASLTTNNQLNALGVRVNSQGKLQIEVSVINPFNGTAFQQAGLWFGLSDKTFLKLVTFNNKVQLYKETNDVSGSADHRTTGTISGLETATLRLRLIVDPATNTVEGFYSTNGTSYVNVGATYSTPSLSISGMELTTSTANTGIFATHRNGSSAVTYRFDNFSVTAPDSNTSPAGTIDVTPVRFYDNDVANSTPGISRVITIRNTSATDPLSITDITLSGSNANQFMLSNLPVLPADLAPNTSATFNVQFHPSTSGLKTASLSISSNDPNRPTVQVALRGLGTTGTGGTNEPSLQAILNLWEIPVSVGDDDANTNIIHSNSTQQKAALLGEEVSMQKFMKAGAGAVTIEPLSVFGPTAVDPVLGMGWYKSGNVASQQELFTVLNSPATNGQTVNVVFNGTLNFDPGDSTFGFYSRWPNFSNRHVYSEDALNTFTDAIPHHVRVYPYKDRSGNLVPFAYIVAFEEHISGFDYQDLVFVVRNVKSVSAQPPPPPPPSNFTTIAWGTMAPQQFRVSEAQGKAVNGKLYTFGGFDILYDCCRPTSRALVYDPTNNSWTPIASLPPQNGTGKGGVTHAGFATDGKDIYFAGGYTSNGGSGQIFGTKEVWKYIVAENRYVRLPDLPVTISAGQLEFLNGRLHHISGTNAARTIDLADHYVLDLNNLAGGWKTLAPLPNPRQHAGSAVFNGKIYFIGGQKGHDDMLVTQKDVHMYDPATNTWTKMADLPVPTGANGRGHISNSVIVADNRIFVLGGETKHGSATNMVSAYNPATNTWSNLTSMPAGRASGVAANLNGQLYYVTGSNSSTTYRGSPGGIQMIDNFTLIHADNELPIQFVRDGSVLNLAKLPTRNLNIRANSFTPTVGSVVLNLIGAENRSVTDNAAPYALLLDNNGNYPAWTPKVGSYTLTAIPYKSSDGTGTAGTPLTINFTVIDEPDPVPPPGPHVLSYTLINAETNEPIQTMVDGNTLNLAALPTRKLNIIANIGTVTVNSIVFNLSGAETRNFTDNAGPFALQGDNNGNYAEWTPKQGWYTLKATPYPQTNATGAAGTPLTINFAVTESSQNSDVTILPIADAFVRDGSTANTNYGFDTTMAIRGTTTTGNRRNMYLKFPLGKAADVLSAKLRFYGRNIENNIATTTAVFGVDNDAWLESGITWNNAPAAVSTALGTVDVNNIARYYEVDVTAFTKAQLEKDGIVSFLVSNPLNQNRTLSFNSREHVMYKPQLVITTTASAALSNAQLFVENLDRFPSHEDFVASRIQNPWSRDYDVYNTDHDTVRVRIHNKGMSTLTISNLLLSNKADWRIATLRGTAYDSSKSLPFTINSNSFADLKIAFVADDPFSTARIKQMINELTIISNDDKQPTKTVYLRGTWQRDGEGSKEPRAQEMINAFGFKSKVGFTSTDPDKGNASKPKGDEVISSYFVRADLTLPVTIRQMGVYHGCCTQSENLRWYAKGNSGTLTSLVFHVSEDAQRLLPRRSRSLTYTPSEGSFNPTVPFGFKVGGMDWTDTLLNPGRLIGIRVWKAIDKSGQVIPNAYIIANDYLGTTVTNYDYNDNMYYVTNIRPEFGPASTSILTSTPQAVEFGEQVLNGSSSFTLNLKSLGQVYPNGAQDPAITISSVVVEGENNTEFMASMPVKTNLLAGETTTLNVDFKPVSEGLKIADLLIYYNNAKSPLRVPLYGIAKANKTIVSVPYRINSGSSSNVTVNGKTWVADTPYAFDNLEPYTNTQLKEVSATDDDVIYLREQSSNGDRKPFRYEMPIPNGTYWVRLHFAEIFWGVPGGNLNGGAGSRVMSVHIENQLRLINLDVVAEVGTAAAYVRNLPVTVSDGKLNINFSASVNRPMVCAIEVYEFKSSDLMVNQHLLHNQPVSNSFEKPKVYPNPLHRQFTIEFPTSYSGTVNLQLSDVAGKVYELGKIQLGSGGVNKQVDLSKLNLPAGVYLLRILSEGGKAEVIKLLIH